MNFFTSISFEAGNIFIKNKKLFITSIVKLVDCSWGQVEGSFFNSYYTEV